MSIFAIYELSAVRSLVSSISLGQKAISVSKSLELSQYENEDQTVAGYGPMAISDFGSAVAPVLKKRTLENLTLNLVVRRKDHAFELQEALRKAGVKVTE